MQGFRWHMDHDRTMTPSLVSLGLLLALMLQGCTSMGPGSLRAGRAEYNQAIQRSNDEQMLLNLVRLKYRDAPFFLGVGSVSAQMNYTAGLSGNGSFNPGVKPSGGVGLSLGYAEKPTVSYAPLQGEQFIKQLLTPLSLDRLVLLYHSGWSAERIFRICVQRINSVRNAPRASGPTPGTEPVFQEFREVASLLRTLQLQDEIDLMFDIHNGQTLPVLVHKAGGTHAGSDWEKLLTRLGVEGTHDRLFLTEDARVVAPEFLHVKTRSFMGVLFLLSQSVVAPEEDEEKGVVTVTRDAAGQRFEWRRLTGGLMHIDQADHAPGAQAAVAIRYRERWFFVADNDLTSKSTFSLLHQLFSLQAGKINVQSPLLMLSAGG